MISLIPSHFTAFPHPPPPPLPSPFPILREQINDDYYECLTPATMKELLEACKKGKKPDMGRWGSLPLNGQVSCEGEREGKSGDATQFFCYRGMRIGFLTRRA